MSDKILPKGAATLTKQLDPEMAAARETVRFTITGMTCTGCSNKALKTLNSLDGISRAEVVFISSMGEVDIDPHVTSAETVLRQLERETGFSCTRIVQDEQVLDVLMPAHCAKQLQDGLPTGITSITKAGQTYRVAFDPVVIGARSVLSTMPNGRLAPPQDPFLAKGKKELQRLAWSTGLATVFTVPILVLSWSDISTSYSIRSITSLVLATIVQAIAIPEFYVGALRSLIFSAVVEMDMLVVISITAAYGYSVVAFALTHAGHQLEQGEFFETSSLLITLVLLGRLIAGAARAKAVSTVSFTSLQAETAFLVHESGECQEIDARLLQLGDTILIRAHSRIVTDGVIVKGTSSVDESMLTGENLPVAKGPDDPVTAGTMNGPGPLTVRLTRLPGQNSISDIARLVEDAIAAKPRVQDLADRIAGWFIPAVVATAIIVFVIWIVIALKVRGKNAGGAVGQAITYSIAVLAISCPCALGLAVPMVLVITGGVAARAGVVVKQADATERAFKVTDVVFDKTGTLTTSVLEVVSAQILTEAFGSKEISSLVYALLKDNDHPVALAVRSFLQQAQVSPLELESIETIPGAGTQALWKGMAIRGGNPYWLGIEDNPSVTALARQGMTLLCITAGLDILAVYGLKTVIRQEATDVVAKLHRKGITCHTVSGDGYQAVKDIACAVGIPPGNIAARQSPAQKQQYVKQLMDQGKTVLFCGDGTNDAVAIAQATVGVQIGSASDVTRAAADVVLLGGLDGILVLLDVSRRAFHRIVFNFVWSAVYNIFAILLAAGAFVTFRIPPAYAGVGEVVSVLPVIIAALSLAFIKQF
jgi:Cu2+-exporting ATPase